MTGLADSQKRRLDELRKEVAKRGFDRYASVLKKVSELPVELQSTAVTALAERETIHTIVAFPPQIQRGWHYVPKQALLFTESGVIYLLASIWPGEEPQVTILNGCNLMYLKVKLLLLYGFLELVVQGPDRPIRLGMEFNTVDWYCLSQPLKRLLQITQTPLGPLTGSGIQSFRRQQALENLPLKFSNGLEIYGLLPGEELEELTFQPGTWMRWLYFLRRPILANTLLSLTSHYLVVIQEEINMKQGWVIAYIPRNNIMRIQNRHCGLWKELSIQLKRADQSTDYTLRLNDEAVEAWRRSWVQHGGRWTEQSEQQV